MKNQSTNSKSQTKQKDSKHKLFCVLGFGNCVLFVICVLGFVFFAPTSAFAIKLQNPLGEGVTGFDVYARIIRALLGFAGVVAILNGVASGIQLLWARGNPEKIQKARDNLLYTVIALLLLFGTYALSRFIIEILSGPVS